MTECRHAVGRERRLTHHMSHGIVYYIKHLLFETFETFWKERHPNDPETPAQAEQKNHPESGRSPTPNFQTPEEKRRPPNNPQMTSLNSSRDDRYCLAFHTCKGPKSECTGSFDDCLPPKSCPYAPKLRQRPFQKIPNKLFSGRKQKSAIFFLRLFVKRGVVFCFSTHWTPARAFGGRADISKNRFEFS